MRLSDARLRRYQTKLIYPNHRLPPWLTEDAARDRFNRLLDGCADGKFAPSKMAPHKYSKYYPKRGRGQGAVGDSRPENHAQNLGSAVGITRDTDVQETISDNRQYKRIRYQKADASPEPSAPGVGPNAAKRREDETRCGTNYP